MSPRRRKRKEPWEKLPPGRPRRLTPRMQTMVRLEPDQAEFLLRRCKRLNCSRQDFFVGLLEAERARVQEGLIS